MNLLFKSLLLLAGVILAGTLLLILIFLIIMAINHYLVRKNRPEPRPEQIRLINQADNLTEDELSGYLPDPSWHYFILRECYPKDISDFCDIMTDCAVEILANVPIVVNHLRKNTIFTKHSLWRNEELHQYLHRLPYNYFTGQSSVATITRGPDSQLASCYPHDDGAYDMSFYGFNAFSADAFSPGQQYPYDIYLWLLPHERHLRITTKLPVSDLISQITAVCQKHSKILITEGVETDISGPN